MAKLKRLTEVAAADYLTVEEAAARLGMLPSSVRNLLTSGQFTRYKFKTLTLVSVREVNDWRLRPEVQRRRVQDRTRLGTGR